MTLKKKPFGNIVGKGENAGNQHFLKTFFLTLSKTEIMLKATLKFVVYKFFRFGEGQNFVVG